MKTSKLILAAAGGIVGLVGAAQAAPLINVSVVGRPAGSADAFSSSIQVVAGQSYEYQVRIDMASTGTSNTQGATVRTVSTLNNNPASSTQGDGVNSMSFDLLDVDGDGAAINFGGVGQLATSGPSSWATGASQSPGTLTSGDILDIRPVHGAGVFTGVGGDLVYSGTFTVSSIDSVGTINPAWSGTISGAKVNTGATVLSATNTTETGADPFFGYTPLTVNAVPEPASVGVLAGAAGLLIARRRRGAIRA